MRFSVGREKVLKYDVVCLASDLLKPGGVLAAACYFDPLEYWVKAFKIINLTFIFTSKIHQIKF